MSVQSRVVQTEFIKPLRTEGLFPLIAISQDTDQEAKSDDHNCDHHLDDDVLLIQLRFLRNLHCHSEVKLVRFSGPF